MLGIRIQDLSQGTAAGSVLHCLSVGANAASLRMSAEPGMEFPHPSTKDPGSVPGILDEQSPGLANPSAPTNRQEISKWSEIRDVWTALYSGHWAKYAPPTYRR